MQQKTHAIQILGGMVLLVRLYVGDSPDECGTVAEWEALLWPIYNALPFPDLWRKLRIRGVHMDSPDLDDETKRAIANLQDYDTTQAGYQVAAGLNFGTDRLEVGFFPDGWRPEDLPQVRPISDANRKANMATVAHEMGHFIACLVGYNQNQTQIRRDITRLFNTMSPIQAQNMDERWAEVCRAFFGAPGARGFFSDNRPYSESDNPKLYTLMAGAYLLQAWLAAVDYTDLQVWGPPDQPNENRVLWQQWRTNWGYRYSEGWFSLDRNFRRWRWAANASGQWGWQPA